MLLWCENKSRRALAGFLEVDDLGNLMLAARALINALIIALTFDGNSDERHSRATLRHRGDAIGRGLLPLGC
jgi:hypothetical protein